MVSMKLTVLWYVELVSSLKIEKLVNYINCETQFNFFEYCIWLQILFLIEDGKRIF